MLMMLKSIDNWRLESEWWVPANYDTLSPFGGYLDNPYESHTRLDSRGELRLYTNLVLNMTKQFGENTHIDSFILFSRFGIALNFSFGYAF